MLDAETRLAAPGLEDRLRRLGLRGPDLPDALDAARRVLADGRGPDVQQLAERVAGTVGGFLEQPVFDGFDPWRDPPADDLAYGVGVLPLLAMAGTAEEVAAFHTARGIPAEISWGSLADLGQQVWVHRQTYGTFGLHTHGWLRIAWSGALLWLGRLQYTLQREELRPGAEPEWVLSTHIPQSGPLLPDAVDDSFALAREVFGAAFWGQPTRWFHCHSWLLDPQLAAALPGTNLAAFQQRWACYGEPDPGDDDVVFFVFRRRGAVDLDELPQDSRLERAVVRRLRQGGHWQVWSGLVEAGRSGR